MPPPRLIYLDPGLRDNLGHHATSCREITGVARARGMEAYVLAFAGITPQLKAEFGALPTFSTFTYMDSSGDPVCGWLEAFYHAWNATRADLIQIRGIAPTDIVYVNSALPAQFLAVGEWLGGLPVEARPHAVIEFGTAAGVDITTQDGQTVLVARDPRQDPRGLFYRFAARRLNRSIGPHFHLATHERFASEIYSSLIGWPVETLPLPSRITLPSRDRTGVRPIVIGVLGHQRPEKGYHLVPEVVRAVLQARPEVRFLVHNAAPDFMHGAQAELRAIAATEPRLTLDERVADQKIWSELLDRSDIVLCPYEPSAFVTSYSAVMSEAIATALPTIVPAGTSLERWLKEYGGWGAIFGRYDAEAVTAATLQAVDRFDELARGAWADADRWNAVHGSDQWLDTVLGWAGLAAPVMASGRVV